VRGGRVERLREGDERGRERDERRRRTVGENIAKG